MIVYIVLYCVEVAYVDNGNAQLEVFRKTSLFLTTSIAPIFIRRMLATHHISHVLFSSFIHPLDLLSSNISKYHLRH